MYNILYIENHVHSTLAMNRHVQETVSVWLRKFINKPQRLMASTNHSMTLDMCKKAQRLGATVQN